MAFVGSSGSVGGVRAAALAGAQKCDSRKGGDFVSNRNKSNVTMMAWTEAGGKEELVGSDGSTVVVLGGQKVLLKAVDGEVYAVSNKCAHLGLPLEGKVLKAKYDVQPNCVTCAAHGTSFDIKTGEVVGKWCPSLPGFVANLKKPAPLPTYPCRVVDGKVEVDV
eukprot:CAMPEP_0185843842 /NCGR_PEP_ID=MMETSP1354-20130828/225_1 /TAXON_ID=708628 /ORGANISM="Erythrolobus madagascarensis, Strain CCMP3276" /LENGTH=163 /DNA_ID=CAMNT_0028543409 /DNA_START=36 /DNA_END=527 /DNA_ORIENTATION=-